MRIDVDGTRLWFDTEGLGLVPDGSRMRARPTLVLLHGGPGSYDHTYFKPHLGPLVDVAQLVYVDLRDHGRSSRHDPAGWSFERCADDIRALCDALGIERPFVLGHSMGGIVAMLYGSRHPGHAGGLILLATMARFDLDRLVMGVRAVAGDDVAELARRDYGGDDVTDKEWALVFAAFGPHVPDPKELARRIRNPEVGAVGMAQFRRLDILDQLPRITSPTLVIAGDQDPITPDTAAAEILDALKPGVGRLDVLAGAGHFSWLDTPDRLFASIRSFVADVDVGGAGTAEGPAER